MVQLQCSDCQGIPLPSSRCLTPIEYIGAGAHGFVLKVADESKNISVLKIVPVIVRPNDASASRIERERKFYEYLAHAEQVPNLARAIGWWSIENVDKSAYLKWNKALRKRLNADALDPPSWMVGNTSGEFKLCVSFVQMKYYASGNLKKWLECNSDKCTETYALRVELFYDTLNAVDFLHQRGLIHRDICPNNIFLTQDNHQLHAVLGDFDSIVSCGEQAQWPLTKVREYYTRMIGTDPYAAPEIDGGNYDKQCDLFSLGVIAINMFFNILDYSQLRYTLHNIRENKAFPTCIFSEDATLWLDIVKTQLSGTPQHRISSCRSMELIKTRLKLRQESSIKTRKSSLYLLSSNTNTLIKLKNFGSRSLAPSQMSGSTREDFSVAGWAGKMYVIGGRDSCTREASDIVQQYDTQTGWHWDWPPMLEKRWCCGAATLGGRLFAVGGYNKDDLSSAEECDLETRRWVLVASMTAARASVGVTTLGNLLFAVGGWHGLSVLNSVELFDPRAGIWTKAAPMSEPRSSFGCAALGDRLYVAGGFTGVEKLTASVEWFDLRTSRWTRVRDMVAPRCGFALAALNGQLLAAGGNMSGGDELNTVEAYDEKQNVWSTLDVRLPRDCWGAGCVLAD